MGSWVRSASDATVARFMGDESLSAEFSEVVLESHMSFVIRPATANDLDDVLRLIQELADFEHLPGPDADAAARLRAQFGEPHPPFQLTVVDVGERVEGYACTFMNYSTFRVERGLYLEDLFVDPAHRSRGIGEALLRHLAKLAKELGCARFEWSVLDWNVRAQSFYQRLGAVVMPDWRICRVDGDALEKLAG